nr:immunoglobulin light chain junction region [Macaca mulatta]
CQQNSKWPRTF